MAPDLSLGHHMDKMRGPTFKALSMIKPYTQFMNLETRKQLIEAKVLSIPSYGLGLFMSQSEAIKDRFTAIFMRANRLFCWCFS